MKMKFLEEKFIFFLMLYKKYIEVLQHFFFNKKNLQVVRTIEK